MELNGIGNRLLALRKEAGISQEQIAEALGMKICTYRSIEKGRTRSNEKGRTLGRIDTLAMLAEYFNVSLDYLVCGKTEIDHEVIIQLNCLSETEQEKAYHIMKAVIEVLK